MDDQELKARLTPEQYTVTQKAGTERPFTGRYWDTKTDGDYHCIVCDARLFDSNTKFDSGTGWPSFSDSKSDDAVVVAVSFCVPVTSCEWLLSASFLRNGVLLRGQSGF